VQLSMPYTDLSATVHSTTDRVTDSFSTVSLVWTRSPRANILDMAGAGLLTSRRPSCAADNNGKNNIIVIATRHNMKKSHYKGMACPNNL